MKLLFVNNNSHTERIELSTFFIKKFGHRQNSHGNCICVRGPETDRRRVGGCRLRCSDYQGVESVKKESYCSRTKKGIVLSG